MVNFLTQTLIAGHVLLTTYTAASALIRPQPHFLAAGIAAMAAAAMANNNISTNVTSPTSTTASTALATSIAGNPSWGQPPGGSVGTPGGPPGPPPLGFPFGIPGLRHPLFSSGIVLFRKKLDIIFVALQTLVQGFQKHFIFDMDTLYRVITK